MVKRHALPSITSVASDYENEHTNFSNAEYNETLGNRLQLKSGGKYLSRNSGKVKSYCTASANIRIPAFDGDPNDRLKLEFLLITPAMMEYGFHLSFDDDMAKFCRFYDCCLIQLSAQVALVYKRTKLLEKAFRVTFRFEKNYLPAFCT